MDQTISILWKPILKKYPDIDLSNLRLSTTKLELHNSIFDLFPYVEWHFLAPPSLLEEGYFLVGSEIDFIFQSPKEKESITFSFAIVSIINGPSENGQGVSLLYTLILTAPWYFKQSIKSKIYRGSISSVFTQLLKEDIPSLSVTCSNSRDIEDNYYRIKETPSSFISKHIKDFLAEDNEFPFYFTHYNNSLYIIDTKYSKQSFRKYFGISYSLLNSDILKSKQANQEIEDYLILMNLQFLFGNQDQYSLYTALNPGFSYIYRDTFEVKTPRNKPNFYPLISNTEKIFVPVQDQKAPGYTKYYFDDSLRPYDKIYAEKLWEHYKMLLTGQTLACTILPNLTIHPGRYVELLLINQNGEESVYSQTFLVTSTTTIFQGSQAKTELTLSSIRGFTYADERKVLRFFKTI